MGGHSHSGRRLTDEHRRRRGLAHAVVLRVAHHADDFELAAGLGAGCEPPAERVFVREVLAHRVVDHGDLRRGRGVLGLREAAAGQNRDSHQREEIQRDDEPVDAVGLASRIWPDLSARRGRRPNTTSRRTRDSNAADLRSICRTISCCLSMGFSAITARTPQGPHSFAVMTAR
jgi:hypothetical protein